MLDNAEVLLVDDDLDFCNRVTTYFESRAVAVLAATDPRLLQSMNFHEYQVVLLDIDMPRLSGVEALEIIRRQNEQVIIIMVSGHSDITTRLSCLETGADFFLVKPVDLAELFWVVRRALGHQATDSIDNKLAQWRLSLERHALISPEGDSIGLSTSEFRVLEALFKNAPEPVSKEELAVAATGRLDVSKFYTRSLEVLISRVRSRANTDEIKLPVKALRNVGYFFHGNGSIVD